jgi:hypothetical protein
MLPWQPAPDPSASLETWDKASFVRGSCVRNHRFLAGIVDRIAADKLRFKIVISSSAA